MSYHSSTPQIPQPKRLQVAPYEPLEDLRLWGLPWQSRLSRKQGEELEVWEKVGNLIMSKWNTPEMRIELQQPCDEVFVCAILVPEHGWGRGSLGCPVTPCAGWCRAKLRTVLGG